MATYINLSGTVLQKNLEVPFMDSIALVINTTDENEDTVDVTDNTFLWEVYRGSYVVLKTITGTIEGDGEYALIEELNMTLPKGLYKHRLIRVANGDRKTKMMGNLKVI